MKKPTEKRRIVWRSGKLINLCPVHKSDLPTVTKWMNDYESTLLLGRCVPTTLEDEEKWFERLVDNNRQYIVHIETKDGTLIGSMGLHDIDFQNQVATTGAIIGEREYRGKGYGTEAKMLLLHYAFTELNLRKVQSRVLAHNVASRRYQEKTGYVVEGVLKEQVFREGRFVDLVLNAVFRDAFMPLWEEYKNS